MTHEWQERLSEYLDGDLTGDERRACDAHLAACAECAAVLLELRGVVERASGLPDELPAYDLWPVIRAQLGAAPMAATPAPAMRRVPRLAGAGFTWPRLAAAGLTAVALAGTLLWAARERLESSRVQTSAPAVSESVRYATGEGADLSRELREAEVSIVELRTALTGGGSGLDSSTVRVLEQNLALIETSIAESRRALDADPRNPYLREHLEENIHGKLRLLRRAALIASVR